MRLPTHHGQASRSKRRRVSASGRRSPSFGSGANEGDLGLYLHFRIDVTELTERSALLQAARCVCQYISEVSRTKDCLHCNRH